MEYLEFDFVITPAEPGTEILIARLADAGFESFVETETGVMAYIRNANFNHEIMKCLDIMQSNEFVISYTHKITEEKNWNEEWEKSYSAVMIAGQCCIRAPFHPVSDCLYDIIIEPKMSFGTAHHQTTALMIEQILKLNLKGKPVLDMGCGTAVLSVLAAKMGAGYVTAVDNDEWAYYNSLENIERNNTGFIKVIHGDATVINDMYDVIFANINRNVLLEDLPIYTGHLKKDGTLLLSGFYGEDIPVIKEKAEGLGFMDSFLKENWAVVYFRKL